MFTASLLALLFGSSVLASPIAIKPRDDSGYCNHFIDVCNSKTQADYSDAFAWSECVLAAGCTPAPNKVETFLYNLNIEKRQYDTSQQAPDSRDLPRLPSYLFNYLAPSGAFTQQNYIDAVYTALSASSGPYPTDVSHVIANFQQIATWTNNCGSQGISFQSLADWLQYSSYVSSTACSFGTAVLPAPDIAGATTTSTYTSDAAAATATQVSNDVMEQKMFTRCIDATVVGAPDMFYNPECLMGALGHPVSVQQFVNDIYASHNDTTDSPSTTNGLSPLSDHVFYSISKTSDEITQQAFIDGWYALLSSFEGPYGDASLVVGYYKKVQAWTAQCQGIPQSNLQDYLSYSSTVAGPNTQC